MAASVNMPMVLDRAQKEQHERDGFLTLRGVPSTISPDKVVTGSLLIELAALPMPRQPATKHLRQK